MTTKTAREILEEALWAISPGEYKKIRNEIKNMGWIKGSEMETDTGTEEGRMVAVCSIGAIALATLDKYQLGDVIPKGGWAEYGTVVHKDKNTLMAAVFLWRSVQEFIQKMVDTKDSKHRLWWINQGEKKPDLEGFSYLDTQDWDIIVPAVKDGQYRRIKTHFSSGKCQRGDIEMWAGEDIAIFNDDYKTSWDDVIDCFKQAIKYAVEDEEKVA